MSDTKLTKEHAIKELRAVLKEDAIKELRAVLHAVDPKKNVNCNPATVIAALEGADHEAANELRYGCERAIPKKQITCLAEHLIAALAPQTPGPK